MKWKNYFNFLLMGPVSIHLIFHQFKLFLSRCHSRRYFVSNLLLLVLVLSLFEYSCHSFQFSCVFSANCQCNVLVVLLLFSIFCHFFATSFGSIGFDSKQSNGNKLKRIQIHGICLLASVYL